MAKEKENNLQKELGSVIKAMKTLGHESYIVALSSGDMYSTHTEKMPPTITSRIVISLFRQFIDHQISITGDRPQYQAAVIKLGEDFSMLLRDFNANIANVEKTPTQE